MFASIQGASSANTAWADVVGKSEARPPVNNAAPPPIVVPRNARRLTPPESESLWNCRVCMATAWKETAFRVKQQITVQLRFLFIKDSRAVRFFWPSFQATAVRRPPRELIRPNLQHEATWGTRYQSNLSQGHSFEIRRLYNYFPATRKRLAPLRLFPDAQPRNGWIARPGVGAFPMRKLNREREPVLSCAHSGRSTGPRGIGFQPMIRRRAGSPCHTAREKLEYLRRCALL